MGSVVVNSHKLRRCDTDAEDRKLVQRLEEFRVQMMAVVILQKLLDTSGHTATAFFTKADFGHVVICVLDSSDFHSHGLDAFGTDEAARDTEGSMQKMFRQNRE